MRALRGDEAELFREHADDLLRIVRSLVVAPEAMIEDACSVAWEQFMRHQPERGPKLVGWLRTVAVREVWRLSHMQRREPGLHEVVDPNHRARPLDETWETAISASTDTEQKLEAKHALAVLAELPGKQQRYLSLAVGGYGYDEIARVTGATYTNVNKHLSRARAIVREARQAA